MTRVLLLAVLFSIPLHAATAVSLCDLVANPEAYDGREIELTSFVSHGFEDFTLFDPRCTERVWVEYGGTIVRDRKLKQFDRLVRREPDSVVHATLRGRFVARENGRGYGHFGMFSLFVIGKVVSVDPHDRDDVDYRANTDAPDADCVTTDLSDSDEILEQQRSAETERAWAFADPARVAAERRPGVALREVSRSPGRRIYAGGNVTVVVSRPYWLTFFAAKRQRIAWVPVAVFETGC